MNTKPKQLMLAIGLGALALLGNKWYINSRIDEVSPKNYIAVVVAKKQISAGTTLNTGVIEQKKIPEKYVPKAAIRWNDHQSYLGQEVGVDVLSGDYVLDSSFSKGGSVGNSLSEQVSGENSRAITIPVDETNSLSRSIVTGDRLDIVFTFNVPVTNQQMSILLFQNVPVIATGAYSVTEQELGGRAGRTKNYSTLTLRLTAQDALRLNFARQVGKISTLLRNTADSAVLDLQPVAGVFDLLSATDREAIQRAISQQQNLPGRNPADADKMKEQIKEMMDLRRQQGQAGRGLATPGGK